MNSPPHLFKVFIPGSILILVCCLLQPITSQAAPYSLIFKVKDLHQLSLDYLVKDLKDVRVLTIGEQHNNSGHHLAQLQIINALHEAEYNIAIGFEQFGVRSQAGLDSWVGGRTSVEDLFRLYSQDWELNWWPLYLPIFEYAREHEIPMVGLNIPREIVRQVASRGFSSLNEEQRGNIKVLSCSVDQKYKDTLSRVLGQKGKRSTPEMFDHFCEAQVVWDTSMALNAVDYIKANPKTSLVILAGNYHSWKRGIPEQIRQVMDIEVISILPSEDTSFFKYDILLEDADYVWWFE
jgi:uncharacterized iron-regulated protein